MKPKDYATLKSKLVKGTRVICRIDKNEWYCGTIESTLPFRVLFDDGSRTSPPDDEIRFIKRMYGSFSTPHKLTEFQARQLRHRYAPRVLYDELNEKRLAFDLSTRQKPWIEFQYGLNTISTLVPFNELLTIDFRSPLLEYRMGMSSVPIAKLTPKIADDLVASAADTVKRFAKACGLNVQTTDDVSRFFISNAHVRQQVAVKLGAFKTGLSYVQVIPF